jgi:hypothetical protein
MKLTMLLMENDGKTRPGWVICFFRKHLLDFRFLMRQVGAG